MAGSATRVATPETRRHPGQLASELLTGGVSTTILTAGRRKLAVFRGERRGPPEQPGQPGLPGLPLPPV